MTVRELLRHPVDVLLRAHLLDVLIDAIAGRTPVQVRRHDGSVICGYAVAAEETHSGPAHHRRPTVRLTVRGDDGRTHHLPDVRPDQITWGRA